MTFWNHIHAAIEQATGIPVLAHAATPVGGGSINNAYRLQAQGVDFFVKTNRPELADMFAAEAEGLNEIVNTGTVHAPQAICWGVADQVSYVVLEYLKFGHAGKAMATLGEQLAAMHRHSAEQFGWHRENTIGATRQINDWRDDWLNFFRDQRLGFQFELAARNGYGGELARLGDRLMASLDRFFAGYSPSASLLHGDLWSGNYAVLEDGQPVIFDPAVYYGDREADIAMTELFGGFGGEFYAAYNASYPLDEGYQIRKRLYNLYHIVNHTNLFGGGYHGQALHMAEALLAEVKC